MTTEQRPGTILRYYRNGKIFTGADETTFATAFALQDGAFRGRRLSTRKSTAWLAPPSTWPPVGSSPAPTCTAFPTTSTS